MGKFFKPRQIDEVRQLRWWYVATGFRWEARRNTIQQ